MYPCSNCHLDVGRDSLQYTTCFKRVHFLCSSLFRADFRTICATGTAVGWRCPACCPLSQTGPPTQTTPASPPPPPSGLGFEAVNIHQAACSFSPILVKAAKAFIPFGRLGCISQSLVVAKSRICSAGETEGLLRGTPV